MTEQAQGQPAPEGNLAEAAQTQDQETQQDRTLTWEEHTRELQRVGKKEKSEGRTALLKDLGFETPDDLKEFVQGYRALEAETQSEAERLQQQLEGLKPKAERSEALEQALTGYLEREREGLPDHITKLLDRMDVVEQLSYLNENRDALKEPEAPQTVGRGSAPGAGNGGGGTPEEQHARSLASLLGQFNGT